MSETQTETPETPADATELAAPMASESSAFLESLAADVAQQAEASLMAALSKKREDERDAARAEVASLTDKLARYETLLSGDIEKRVASWPDEVKQLLPNETDAFTRLAHLLNLQPLADKLLAAPAAPGLAPAPVPGAQTPSIDDLKQRKLQGGAYPSF